jgi:Flp pilus assembly protein TadD
LRKGETDLAVENFTRAIDLNANYPDAYNNRGYAYKVKGDIDRAIEDYNRAISLGSKNPQHFVKPRRSPDDKGGLRSRRGGF